MTSALDISFGSTDNPPVSPPDSEEVDPLAPVPPPGEDELPCDDGEPMETELHVKQMTLLIGALEIAWKDRDDVYVGGNMFLYFSETQIKKNDFRGPDVFVVLDTVRRVRKSWVVWQEERTPNVIIELLSRKTEKIDRGKKMDVYAKVLRVQEYYLYDPETHVFEGYTLDLKAMSYVRMSPAESGDLVSDQLGLRLGIRRGKYHGAENDWLRWLDAEGNVLPSGEELARAAQKQARSAQKQARSAQKQARSAQKQARALEEQARAAEEQTRAAEEQARAAEEQARALAAKLAEYEKRFGKLDG